MSVLAWQPTNSDRACASAEVECAPSLNDLMRRSDIVTVHMVLADSTRGLIGPEQFSLMKPSALLVNSSRGAIVDEAALIEALVQNRIAGAALDVFDKEPLPPEHPFRTMKNVLASPHLGYVTEENYRLFYGQAVEDIKAWQNGSPLRVLTEME